MDPSPPALRRARFGVFEVDRSASRLLKGGKTVKLAPQPFKVLLLLLDRQGQVVSRGEIQRHLWDESTFVDFERGINFSINQIRAALSDDPERPRYIETLPKLGYRFVAAVTHEAGAEPAVHAAQAFESESDVSDGSEREAERSDRPPPTQADGESEIQRVPMGYRFADAATAAAPMNRPAQQPNPRWWWRSPVLWVGCAIVLVFAAVMFIDRSRPQPNVPAVPAADVSSTQLHIRKLTDNDQVTDVAISPDGRYVVFVRGEGQGLWLRQIDTGTDVEILPGEGVGVSSLTFSPDGSLIYFVKHHADDPFAGSLYSMSMLGGAPRKVLDGIKAAISFAPDGKRFVYESCWSDGVQFRVARVDRDDDRQLATIRKAQCGFFQAGPSWSPDGRTIVAPVFLSNEQWLLVRVSADDGTVGTLLSSGYRIGRPRWLPGGHSLLVPHAEEEFKEFQLWTVTFPGGEAHRLSDDLTWYDQKLDATPDGRTAVSIVSTRVSDIWTMSVHDPRQARQVSSGLPVFKAAELANGRILAVDREGRLWTMDSGGGPRTSFSSLRHVNTFERCGNVVVAQVDVTPTTVRLFRVDADGSHAVPLTDGIAFAPAACSSKGDYVYYTNRDQVFRIPLAGGPPHEVGRHLQCLSFPLGLSPDGVRLACLQHAQDASAPEGWRLAILHADNGSPIASWPVRLSPYPRAFRWFPQGVAWQFLRSARGGFNIWDQPIGRGSATQLTTFTSGRIFNFDASVDGKRLVMTRGSLSQDVVLLTFK